MNRLSLILAAILVLCTISRSALVPSKSKAAARVAGASLSQKLISLPKPTIRDDSTDENNSDDSNSGDPQSDNTDSDSNDSDSSSD